MNRSPMSLKTSPTNAGATSTHSSSRARNSQWNWFCVHDLEKYIKCVCVCVCVIAYQLSDLSVKFILSNQSFFKKN